MQSRFPMTTLSAALLASVAFTPLFPASAQEIPGITPTPAPTPAPPPTPTRITPPITYSLPSGSGTEPAPTPQQAPPQLQVPRIETPAAQPEAAPVQTRATPVPRTVVPTPVEERPAPTPTVNEPVPTFTPAETVPAITADRPPADDTIAQPSVALPAAEPVEDSPSGWPWLLGIAAALLAIGGVVFARRRAGAAISDEAEAMEVAVAPEPEPLPVAAVPAIPIAPRPAPAPSPSQPAFLSVAPKPATPPQVASPIEIALIPHRAGMTILEGVIDFSLIVTNRGAERTENMLLSAFLRTAHAHQDDEIAQLLAAPLDPRDHNPFALASGESRRFDAGLTIPKAMIHAVPAGDRRVFVPLLTVSLRYRAGLTTGKRTARAFMVGRARPGSERLGPLPFDGEPRMFDALAARVHVPAATGALRMAG